FHRYIVTRLSDANQPNSRLTFPPPVSSSVILVAPIRALSEPLEESQSSVARPRAAPPLQGPNRSIAQQCETGESVEGGHDLGNEAVGGNQGVGLHVNAIAGQQLVICRRHGVLGDP